MFLFDEKRCLNCLSILPILLPMNHGQSNNTPHVKLVFKSQLSQDRQERQLLRKVSWGVVSNLEQLVSFLGETRFELLVYFAYSSAYESWPK